MAALFLFLFFISLFLLIIGLLSPKKVIRWGNNPTRKKVLIYFGIATILFFILTGVFADTSKNSLDNNTNVNNNTNLNNQISTNTDQLATSTDDNLKQDEQLFLVKRVIDGDTIELDNGQKVRYIGIDTPETVHPSIPVQCFGQEASNKNKELVEGKMIRMEKDVSETDRYGRLLRYIYVDNLFVNDYLVRNGYAYADTVPPDVKYSDQFVKAQQEARENNRGLWLGCPSQNAILNNTNTSNNQSANQNNNNNQQNNSTPGPTSNTSNYICSYNAYNCTDFTTHAEAQAVYEYCGGVNNDIHQLDRDKDGQACETLP